MMKIVALACLVAVTQAKTIDELQESQATNARAAARLIKMLNAGGAGMDMLQNGMAKAIDSTTTRVSDTKGDMKKTTIDANEVKAFIGKLASGKAYTDEAAKKAKTSKDALKASLQKKLAKIRSDFKGSLIPAAKQPLGSPYATSFNKIKASNSAVKSLKAQTDAFLACQKKQQIHNGQGCKDPAQPTDMNMERVAHQLWTNDDSRNGGYLNNREITFTKNSDSTYIRVMYYDNMRVHGHTSHAMWEIYICDANGNSCGQCNNPGRMMHWRWSGHQHNWWINDHSGGTVYGICKSSTSKGNLGAGNYKLRVNLHSNRYDIHTGHQGQHGSFMVDEVLKV